MNKFKVVYASNVKFEYLGDTLSMFIVDEHGLEYHHLFHKKSKTYQEFIKNDTDDFVSMLVGAPFVFISNDSGEWRLVDYRTNRNKVFVQSEENLSMLSEILGVDNSGKQLILGSKSFKYEFETYDQGSNTFEAALSLPFSPFQRHVSCSVGLERLICLNGMITNASVFSYKIPVLNNVRENIEIGLSQIIPNVKNSLKERLEKMQNETASLAEAKRVHNFVVKRNSPANSAPDRRVRIQSLALASNVFLHCKNYAKDVLEDRQSCKFLPSHLTRFDLWNILTELDSHTDETEESKSRSVQRYINTIMFNSASFCETNELAVNTEFSTSGRFNASHQQAFFGR